MTSLVRPYLAYADAPAAIDFLCQAFGFEERSRYPMPDGRIGHAELGYGDASVYLASVYHELGLASPTQLDGIHCQLHCLVDDVDAHYARALAAGATLVGEPSEDHGLRSYRAVDPEGHRWIFAQELSAAAAGAEH